MQANLGPQQSLEKLDYGLPQSHSKGLIHRFKKSLAIISLFLISLLFYSDLLKILKNSVQAQLASLPGCAIRIKEMETMVFPPGIKFHDLNFQGPCAGSLKNISLTQLVLHLRGPSFSPLGLQFSVNTEIFSQSLQGMITLGFGGLLVKLENQVIKLQQLPPALIPFQVSGKLDVNLLVGLNGKEINQIYLNLFSKDLILPGQQIQSFQIQDLPVRTLSIKLRSEDGKKIQVEDFLLGDENSPLRANLKGTITPNYQFMQKGQLDLNAELSLSEGFKENYSFVLLFLNNFTQKDGYYQIKISGLLEKPEVKSAL